MSQKCVDALRLVDEREQLAAREEEEGFEPEDTASCSSEDGGGHANATVKAAPGADGTQRAIQVLLENLRNGHAPEDESTPTPVDSALQLLRDCAALSRAWESLEVHNQAKSSLDVVFRGRIVTMIGLLNLFLDLGLSYTWREASMVVVKAQGRCHRRVDDALNSMCRIVLVPQSTCTDHPSVRPWDCSTDRRYKRGGILVSTDQLSSGSA